MEECLHRCKGSISLFRLEFTSVHEIDYGFALFVRQAVEGTTDLPKVHDRVRRRDRANDTLYCFVVYVCMGYARVKFPTVQLLKERCPQDRAQPRTEISSRDELVFVFEREKYRPL
jgi:hypothetical protein